MVFVVKVLLHFADADYRFEGSVELAKCIMLPKLFLELEREFLLFYPRNI